MWLMLVPIALCFQAVVNDLKTREIPDTLSACLLVTGLLAAGQNVHAVTLTDAVWGVGIGFLAVFLFTLREGIGGGDLKLVTALGAWLGGTGTVSLLFWSALSGMVAAILVQLRGGKDFPFAPAILAGLLITVLFPAALPTLIEWIRNPI